MRMIFRVKNTKFINSKDVFSLRTVKLWDLKSIPKSITRLIRLKQPKAVYMIYKQEKAIYVSTYLIYLFTYIYINICIFIYIYT